MLNATFAAEIERARSYGGTVLRMPSGYGINTENGNAVQYPLGGPVSLDDADVRAIAERLPGLTRLSIAGSNIGDAVARAVAKHLPGLTALSLVDNNIGLSGVRAIVEHLPGLALLDLSGNNIGDEGALAIVRGLRGLHELFLQEAAISTLPNEIGELSELRHLDLSHNDLQSIPQSMLRLRALKVLRIDHNPRLNLPPEIESHQDDVASLLAWLSGKKRRLNEAKVLMVGQGGVGKTSVVNAVLHGRTADPCERKTERIRIDAWMAPSRHEGERIRVNVWDFGGQEIMHATHQFFLTKRSVYVLVLDARQGEIEGNLHYWLQTIQSFGGDSPVLVVTNKCDVQPLSLNERGIQKQYAPAKIAFYSVSCATLEGIADLSEALAETIATLAHVDDVLPENYFDIKAKLEEIARARHYFEMTEYTRLCDDHDVHDTHDQQRLLRFLHDLGTVLNFDDPNSTYQLGDTNILNPEWVTEGVYAIINNQPLMQAQGRLELERLPEILQDLDRYPRSKQRFIIEMMRKFELCFAFPDSPSTLLVPELLSKNEPDINWKDPKECVGFEYAYTVLPSGLLPRFIVRMHHALTDRPTYWRSGVVLKIDGCKVLVSGNSRTNVIQISVDGQGEARRSALAAVRNEFKAIHARTPKLRVEERVPLPEFPGVAVHYAHLLRLEALSRTRPAADMFIPQGLPAGEEKEYSARALLSGIDRPTGLNTVLAAPLTTGERQVLPRRVDIKHLWSITLIFLAVIGGTACACIAEARLLEDPLSRILALSATVVVSIVAFVYLAHFGGTLKGAATERLIKEVLSKVPVLGKRDEARAEAPTLKARALMKELPPAREPRRRAPQKPVGKG